MAYTTPGERKNKFFGEQSGNKCKMDVGQRQELWPGDGHLNEKKLKNYYKRDTYIYCIEQSLLFGRMCNVHEISIKHSIYQSIFQYRLWL